MGDESPIHGPGATTALVVFIEQAGQPPGGVMRTLYSPSCGSVPPGLFSPAERTASDLHAAIQDAFNRHGVQIMSPHYMDDPKSPKIVPPTQA